MNPTLRRVITAGLGSLAMTDKAMRRLVDDLISKGDITRGEGERILVDLQRNWGHGSARLGEKVGRARRELERMVTSAVSEALDRVGLARKSEIKAPKRRMDTRDAKQDHSTATSSRRRTGRRNPRSASS